MNSGRRSLSCSANSLSCGYFVSGSSFCSIFLNASLAYGRLAWLVFHEVTRQALVPGSASLMNGESSVR